MERERESSESIQHKKSANHGAVTGRKDGNHGTQGRQSPSPWLPPRAPPVPGGMLGRLRWRKPPTERSQRPGESSSFTNRRVWEGAFYALRVSSTCVLDVCPLSSRLSSTAFLTVFLLYVDFNHLSADLVSRVWDGLRLRRDCAPRRSEEGVAVRLSFADLGADAGRRQAAAAAAAPRLPPRAWPVRGGMLGPSPWIAFWAL